MNANDAVVKPYTKHDDTPIQLSNLAIGGVILRLNVPQLFHANRQFAFEALPDYVRERTLVIDYHGQIDIILLWLEQFDQVKNIRKLRLANLVYLVRRPRGAQEPKKEEASKEGAKHEGLLSRKTPKALHALYLDKDGDLTHSPQHLGEHDHVDLITSCT